MRTYKRKLQQKYNKRTTRNKAGYVYVIKVDKYYKIGISTNPDKRYAGMLSLPWPIEETVRIQTSNMLGLENYLHNKYEDKHVNGEWFELSEVDVQWIANNASDKLLPKEEPIKATQTRDIRYNMSRTLIYKPATNKRTKTNSI